MARHKFLDELPTGKFAATLLEGANVVAHSEHNTRAEAEKVYHEMPGDPVLRDTPEKKTRKRKE